MNKNLDDPTKDYYNHDMEQEHDTTMEDIGWPPVVDTVPTPVNLTRKFREIARAWRMPAESLASYVCEEYGDTHSPEQPLIMIVARATS